jgi:ParB family transcriptional regulator, chromosome partitioning protein
MSKKKEFTNLDLLSAYDIKSNNISNIKVSEIHLNPNQPRQFGKTTVDDLIESIERLGLIEPIVLRRISTSKYEIVAGERRFNAVKKLGWLEIPAVITEAEKERCFEMALAENEKRKNLNPWEIGKAIQFLRNDKKKTAFEVGDVLGYTKRYIKQLSSIARLDFKSVNNLINSGIEPSVKNLEKLLKAKEGRGGEIISPPPL